MLKIMMKYNFIKKIVKGALNDTQYQATVMAYWRGKDNKPLCGTLTV